MGRTPHGDRATPEQIFVRRWAEIVLDRALTALRCEYERAGKGAAFIRLKDLLMDEESESHRTVAQRLGMTEGALKMSILRLRRRYRALIRAEIGEIVHDPADVESEVRFLVSALQRH
jgi:RNA polymerase sigma-70 factor (ECF subfamily)